MLVNNAINPMRRNQSLCASMIYHFSFSLLKGALLIALFPKPKCTQAKLDFSAFERRFFFGWKKFPFNKEKHTKKSPLRFDVLSERMEFFVCCFLFHHRALVKKNKYWGSLNLSDLFTFHVWFFFSPSLAMHLWRSLWSVFCSTVAWWFYWAGFCAVHRKKQGSLILVTDF